ncbi:PREDICTED: E3 ubiquitin-protein ligase RBBP6-like [Chaetura pelagica]|uniref:E3 ubiquitin-protein ligase RBBP6-like n=1 Tax=Chaetura pelagica TaxID=8897 RepID=UPI00052398F8|nr:PREDICTED: E3 ubiquitin-protein ligase RBBP6-like [Chaetura pelagica]
MSHVYYKFFSKLNYAAVTFSGLHISLHDLKSRIMGQEKLKVTSCALQVTNAQSREEYTDDNALIPKNSSVIVRRIPPRGVLSANKPYAISQTVPVSGTSSGSQTKPTADLAGANAPEEDKIKAMMIQSCRYYDPAK